MSECYQCIHSPGDGQECSKESKVEQYCDNYEPKCPVLCCMCRNQDSSLPTGCKIISEDESFDHEGIPLPVTKDTELWICTGFWLIPADDAKGAQHQ